MLTTIGVDPHKRSHTAAALAVDSTLIEDCKVAAAKTMTSKLLRWAQRWPERQWAIEGANGLGRLLAQQLVAAGEIVIDVPAKLAARARLLEVGHGRKTDGIDAISVAIVAQRRSDLRRVEAEDHTGVLRLLSDRRDELNQRVSGSLCKRHQT